MAEWVVGQNAMWTDSEPTDCPCECHKPKHEARPPHPDTQIGRK